MIIQTNIITFIFFDIFGWWFRAKTDHWCSQPDGLNFPDDVWRDIAIPQKKSNDSKSCEAFEELKYDKCHSYETNFVDLKQKYGISVDKIEGKIWAIYVSEIFYRNVKFLK